MAKIEKNKLEIQTVTNKTYICKYKTMTLWKNVFRYLIC